METEGWKERFEVDYKKTWHDHHLGLHVASWPHECLHSGIGEPAGDGVIHPCLCNKFIKSSRGIIEASHN